MADGKPGRKKGTVKTGGRKKGTPNKIDKDLRARIASFLDNNFDEAVKAWNKIKDPKEKFKLYTDLIKFKVPVLQAVSLDATVKQEDNIEDDLRELSEEKEEENNK